MKRSLLFTACCMLLVMGLTLMSCKKKEEPATQTEKEEKATATVQDSANEQNLVNEAQQALTETEELEKAVDQGKVSNEEAVQNLTMLKKQQEELKIKAEELGTKALIILMDKISQKLDKVSRSVGMEEIPEKEEVKQETEGTRK